MKKIFKFIRLSLYEKYLFFEILFYLALYRIYIETKQLQQLLRTVEGSQPNHPPPTHSFPPAIIRKFIVTGSKLIPFTTCLSAALAGKVIFSKYGYVTRLHIGVLKNAQCSVEAHAWLTLDESIILGYIPNLEKYQEFHLPSNVNS